MTGFELAPSTSIPAQFTALPCPPQSGPSRGSMIRDARTGLEMRLTETAARARATVLGEIDLGCAPLLEQVLAQTLHETCDGLELDLQGVGFMDCSGLNVLLRLRKQAARSGISVRVTWMSHAVRRMLELTDSEALFA